MGVVPAVKRAAAGSDRGATRAAWRRLRRHVAARYRDADHAARWRAHGKLAFDPMYRALLSDGALAEAGGSRLLDLGCGQALLAALIDGAERLAAEGGWPAGWAPPPRGLSYTGVERDPSDLARARAAAATLARAPRLIAADLCDGAALPDADHVLLLDVLHYLGADRQDALLDRVRTALPAGGRLLLRIGDAGGGLRQAFADHVDRTVATLRGARRVTLSTRTLPDWLDRLAAHGFEARARPMSRGTPFANVLVDARRRGAAA